VEPRIETDVDVDGCEDMESSDSRVFELDGGIGEVVVSWERCAL
jgi:hypothetical protein